MIMTPQEYSEKFLFKGKKVSAKTVTRRCDEGLLPSNHHAQRLPGGDWVIEIDEETEVKKPEPLKGGRSLNTKHFSW
jgi:hypothetical protein